MRSRRSTITKINDARHSNNSVQRSQAAVVSDRPSPVHSVTYAARHAGHLGTNASPTLGSTHAEISRIRRSRFGVFCARAA